MIPDVLTYILAFKDFLKKNEEARTYFIGNTDEDLFFEHFTEIAEKNFKKFGEPQLNKDQLEILRKTMLVINVAKKPDDEIVESDKRIFVEVPNWGTFCLN